MKQCNSCGETKSLEMYHKHSGMSDGHLNQCRVCRNEWVRNYRKVNGRSGDYRNTASKRASRVAYKVRKLKQTCSCCSTEDFRLIYELASLGLENLEVDHIVPLKKGGLHCTSNLQLLSQRENRRKSASHSSGYEAY